MAVAGTIVANVVAKVSNFISGMNKAASATNTLGGAMRKAAVGVGVLTSSFIALRAAMLIPQIIKLATDAESAEKRLSQLLGSTRKAKKLIEDLRKFAPTTPFSAPDMIQSASALITYGRSVKGVQDDLKMLADVAAATGTPILELAQIFGRSSAESIISMERLEQFMLRGVGVGQALVKRLGFEGRGGMAALKKYVSMQKLTFEDLQAVMRQMTEEGGIYFNAAARQSETLAARISALVTNVERLGREFGSKLLPILTFAVDLMNNFVKAIKGVDYGLARQVVNTVTIVVVLGKLIKVISVLRKWYRLLKKEVFAILAGESALLIVRSKGLGIAVVAGAAAAGATAVWGLNKALNAMWEKLGDLVPDIENSSEVINDWRKELEKTGEGWQWMLDNEAAKGPSKAERERSAARKRIMREEAAYRKQIQRLVETPMERYIQQMQKLNAAHATGVIGATLHARATKKYAKELLDATKIQTDYQPEEHLGGGSVANTVGGYGSFLQAQALHKSWKQKQVAIQQQQLQVLQLIERNTQQPPVQINQVPF